MDRLLVYFREEKIEGVGWDKGFGAGIPIFFIFYLKRHS
jgi:hypothetical protein